MHNTGILTTTALLKFYFPGNSLCFFLSYAMNWFVNYGIAMNSVRDSASDLSFNCSLCKSDDRCVGEQGGRLVKASCPLSHVFHLKCITEWLVSEQQAGKRLDLRECSECQQLLLPLIPLQGKSSHDEQSPYWTPLHEATDKKKTDTVKEILAIAPSLAKVKDNNGDTALHVAAYLNHIEIVRELLGIDPSVASCIAKARNENGETAWDLAKHEGNKEIMKVLEHFADSPTDHEKDNSRLTTNVKLDDTDKAVKTAQAGSTATNAPAPTDSETAIDSHKSPLNDAPDTDPAPREQTKIELSTISKNRAALAAYVAETDSEKCLKWLKYLVSEKMNIELADESGKTALHYAAKKGHEIPLSFLIQNGANINKPDNSGKTALHYAILHKHEECVDKLCEKDQHISPANRNRALRFAIDENYHSPSTEKLVKKIDLDEQDETDGKTLLHCAAEKGSDSYLEKFLTKVGSAESINRKDHAGRTPLHYAALEGQSSCIESLLFEVHEEEVKQMLYKNKVKQKKYVRKELTCINDKDNNGDTALLLAAQHSHKACVKELIEAQANVQKKK